MICWFSFDEKTSSFGLGDTEVQTPLRTKNLKEKNKFECEPKIEVMMKILITEDTIKKPEGRGSLVRSTSIRL